MKQNKAPRRQASQGQASSEITTAPGGSSLRVHLSLEDHQRLGLIKEIAFQAPSPDSFRIIIPTRMTENTVEITGGRYFSFKPKMENPEDFVGKYKLGRINDVEFRLQRIEA